MTEAALLTNRSEEGSFISAFSPYGFELHNFPYPKWPTRHYPVLGYPAVFSRQKAEIIGENFKENLLTLIKENDPILYERLQYVKIHRGAKASVTLPFTPSLNTMHIELFPLSPPCRTILDHYAKYVICLFGAICGEGSNLPEIREFYLSKTRRNRLFQEYIMCEAMILQLDAEFPNRSASEEYYFQEIFKQLRIQNVSEVIGDIPTEKMECTLLEEEICNHLIFRRMKMMRERLDRRSNQKGNELIVLRSPTYYDDGKHFIEVSIGKADLKKLMFHIRRIYK